MENGIQPTYNLADHGYDGFGGGSGIWLFAILALMWGGNGLFGNRGNFPTDYARQSDVVTTSAFNQLQDENLQIMNNSQRIGTELQQALYNASYNNLNEIKTLEGSVAELGSNMQNCCCSTLRAIDTVNYNGALNTAAINANTTAQVQKVLDAITGNRMADMQNQITQLQLNQAVSGVVRYPQQTTFTAANPFFPGFPGNGNI